MGLNVAVIGTAGRDKGKPYTKQLWEAMLEDARRRFVSDVTLVSGGAAWADHLAVALFLENRDKFSLRLFLPSIFAEHTQRFVGPANSAASAANFYHEKFSRAIGVDSRGQIASLFKMGNVSIDCEPSSEGYGGMFARNKKVAQVSDACLAYTWGEGTEPADGGTMNTWKQIEGRKVHVPLYRFL